MARCVTLRAAFRGALRDLRGLLDVVGADLEGPARGDDAADGADDAGQDVREGQARHGGHAGDEAGDAVAQEAAEADSERPAFRRRDHRGGGGEQQNADQ